MTTFNKTFSVKNGIDVANTLILDSSRNLTNVNASQVFANTGIFVAGAIVANSLNVNFVSGNTSNINITGTSNTNPGNVTITIDTRVPPGGGGGSPGGANQQLQFNNTSAFGGQANLLYNIASNTMFVEANIALSNASNLYFGGSQANTVANSHAYVTYNTSTTSLDFVVTG